MGKQKHKKDGKGVFAIAGSVSGAGSIISAHNVCHSICLAVVALLSVFGIFVSADILMWLQDYNLFFWTMGVAFLAISLAIYYKMPCCISTKMILFNVGLLIIGLPFLATFNIVLWLIGGYIVLLSISWLIIEKFEIRAR
ncbi:MAG: hypothetical protein HY512_00875 [Candidatus Aenigmarchaeota archaeon]|nr:hypothetical protein [Candidatus Aenigmarchaeota archaeon]